MKTSNEGILSRIAQQQSMSDQEIFERIEATGLSFNDIRSYVAIREHDLQAELAEHPDDEYSHHVVVDFPLDCWQLHGFKTITVPIAFVLRCLAKEADHGACFEAIRNDFYSSDDDIGLATDLDPDINWKFDPLRMAEIRVALKREKRRRELDDAGRGEPIYIPDYLSLDHPFATEHAAYREHDGHNAVRRAELDWQWDEFVECSFADEVAKRAAHDRLLSLEAEYEEDLRSLNRCRSALEDKIAAWYREEKRKS